MQNSVDDFDIDITALKEHGIKHFAIIPDGNRRWAKARGLAPYEGHKRAVKTLENILPVFKELNIPVVTIWAFSTENWKRPQIEIKVLFEILKQLASIADKKLNKNGIKLKVIGRRDRFSKDLLDAIQKAEEITKNNRAYTLVIPLDYGGQDEVRRGILKLLNKIKENEIAIDDAISRLENADQAFPFIDSLMDIYGLPYPDVIMRTSGEMRLSGLYIWQNAYAELFFIKKYFPDLTRNDIIGVVKEFMQRDRRFGGNSKK